MPIPSTGAAQRPAALLTATLALLSFVLPLATDMYLPAFPAMADDLGTDASGVQLTLTAFLFGTAAGHLVLGPLSDRYGRRMRILTGAAVCTLATALCAAAPNLGVLIVLRFVTGFSGATGLVVGRAVISDVATGAVAARVFGGLMALGGIAPIVAPLAGGALVSNAGGCRAVFWILSGASLLMFLAALSFIPESLPKERRRPGGVGATLQAARSVLTDRAYVGYTLAFSFACGALFCCIAGSAFLLQNVLGFTVSQASVAFSSLLVTLAGQLNRVLALGLIAIAFLGIGQVFGTATALALERVPHAAGTGSAVLGTLQSVLGGVAPPIVGLGGEDTAVPLFVGMAGCSLIAVLALLLTRGGTPPPGSSRDDMEHSASAAI
ncbi:MFS transporter [Streptomyces sp. HP-A2021]|uniref:MFS transporter n=1 Tax=Streptomyces sp. HP-A2021 TaxID=2927875 RepID=UPI001FAEB418|nr:MFS transporter [Streptomyces sp. HP-A2021]UOB15330.1 MFS transporter [Streptomyces sp. HP-A2021]